MRLPKFLPILLLTATAASAEPISVTGSMIAPTNGGIGRIMLLSNEHGIIVNDYTARFDFFSLVPCTYDAHSFEFDGVRYGPEQRIYNADYVNSVYGAFHAEWPVYPPAVPIRLPFSFTGHIVSTGQLFYELVGAGNMTLDKEQIRYDFDPIDSTTVPEPASLLLLGVGLLSARKLRRSHATYAFTQGSSATLR